MIQQYKIINDPVHGFINIPGGIILDIIQHPLFQRLKEIKQLGLTPVPAIQGLTMPLEPCI